MYLMCSQCGSRMILRKGPYGEFYGCSRFPSCRYTIKEIDGEDLKEYQERQFERISEENSEAKETIQKIENLDNIRESLDDKEKRELKSLEWKLKDILDQIDKKNEKKQMEESARKNEKGISKFSLNQIPKLSWRYLILHKESAALINQNLQKIREIERTFNQKIETQFFYDEIMKLLEDIKGVVERTIKIVKVPQNVKQFFDKELSEANNILEQAESNCEINRARYKIGQMNFKKGIDDSEKGLWKETNKRWKKAINYLKKVSPSYREYWKGRFVPSSALDPYFSSDFDDNTYVYIERFDCENVKEEIKKVFQHFEKVKKDKDTMIKEIEDWKNSIEGAKKEATKIKNELDIMLKELKQRKNDKIKSIEDLGVKDEEIEKNQYFRLVKISLMYFVAWEKLGMNYDEFEYTPPVFFENTVAQYKEELNRISKKENKKNKNAPVSFANFPGIDTPESGKYDIMTSLEDLIQKMKSTANRFAKGNPGIEKRLQDLKQKTENIKIEV